MSSSSHKVVFIYFHLEQPVVARETSYWSRYLVISFSVCHQYCANIRPSVHVRVDLSPGLHILLPLEFSDILFWKVKSMNEYEVLVCNIVQAQGPRSFIDRTREHWRGLISLLLSFSSTYLYLVLPVWSLLIYLDWDFYTSVWPVKPLRKLVQPTH